jgi:hypothetical protein
LLGVSVRGVGDIDGDGFADFMIGAPGALDAGGTVSNTGRAYLIYGGTALSTRQNKQVDLDNASGNTDLNIITFVSSLPSGLSTGFAGFSVAAVGDVLSDSLPDIAIGAPRSTLNALSQNGAIFVISGAFLRPKLSRTIDLANVGQGGSNNVPGIIFAGANIGDFAGHSVAGAGNFNNDRNQAGVGIDDFLIGAPQSDSRNPNSATGPGYAALVYGSTNLAGLGIVTNGINNISLARLVPGASSPIDGAIFTGDQLNDHTGWSVSTAGDFNADGISDIAIGSPRWDGGNGTNSGRVNLIFGRSVTPNPPGQISGVLNLSNLPATIPQIQFDGPAPEARAGFSISAVGRINNDSINEFLIGAPQFNNNQGIVYLIPGNPDLLGEQNLAAAQAQPLQATVITLSSPTANNFLGESVGGNLFTNSNGQTVDADNVADFTVGAPGFNLNGSRTLAGAGYLLEGARVPLANIVSNAISSNIAIETFPSAAVINPVTPDDLTFFILSGGSNTQGFAPFDDINPNTITVNGIALPDPTTWTNAGDLDGDGIDDASFVFSPRSLLGLPGNSNVTITINARTLASSPFPNRRYTGSQSVRTSGVNPPPPPGNITLTFGPTFENLNRAAPRFGERLLPQLQVINRPRWAPLSVRLAYRQFVPQGAMGLRLRNYFHPVKQHKGPTRTLGSNVFTRGRFPKGVHVGGIDHHGPVIGNGQTRIVP